MYAQSAARDGQVARLPSAVTIAVMVRKGQRSGSSEAPARAHPPSSGALTGTSRHRRSWRFGRDAGREAMIRPLCAAMALVCLSASAFAETCIASRYGYSGGQTASGERMNPNAMTAAHRTRPFGSQVTVTSHASGRSVTVRINDRGPFVKGRCIDLSTGAARALGMVGIEMVSLR